MTTQNPLAPGQTWEVLRGGVVAGHMNITESDGLWHLGEFEPGQLFAEIADLFNKVDKHGEPKGSDARQADVHRLKKLGVKVRLVGEATGFEAFALFVEDSQAKIRIYPTAKKFSS